MSAWGLRIHHHQSSGRQRLNRCAASPGKWLPARLCLGNTPKLISLVTVLQPFLCCRRFWHNVGRLLLLEKRYTILPSLYLRLPFIDPANNERRFKIIKIVILLLSLRNSLVYHLAPIGAGVLTPCASSRASSCCAQMNLPTRMAGQRGGCCDPSPHTPSPTRGVLRLYGFQRATCKVSGDGLSGMSPAGQSWTHRRTVKP